MRRLAWMLAAVLIAPVSSWSQQQSQSQPPAPSTSTASTSTATSATSPAPDSLAEAARKAREQKKDAPKGAKVFTNDNLPAQGGISTVGKASAPESADTPANAPAPGDQEKIWRDKFATLHAKLAQDQADLEVMQRELGVLDVQNYSDPVKAMQQELTRSDINQKAADIDAKTKQIEADKQAIADAEDDLRKAGGDSGWSR
jgi:hypothetical protein